MLVTRAMRQDDLDPVLTNETRAYAFPWTRGMFEDCLKSTPPYDCQVGIRGGSVVAHGILSVGAGESHLLNVCVQRDLQGAGLGREMLDHLVRRAEHLGAGQMFLEVRPTAWRWRFTRASASRRSACVRTTTRLRWGGKMRWCTVWRCIALLRLYNPAPFDAPTREPT